ncbi:hypothetical protein DES53_11140 [Roseimicrobium gellanilyticum]|uniref:Parallel beta helix pectate lyase-like protein n=1 Tax=Roseimicrobium gellanilyticum TaxID=748857 RepID=A0A366HAB2_9BACT|nr:right-handed parallel beta-helix repeat-containing protein [Roseimicrobium gellanilyticum]RBP38522.1 hypothetical protein DES53_11140 [Roseimicrobium gellanilyticum]
MPLFRALLLFSFITCGAGLRAQHPDASPPVPAIGGSSIHVDPIKGDDTHDGVAGPVRTIARAIRLAKPGDTVHLEPATYFESVDLSGKHGEPGRPITIDGHGAIIEGSDPVKLAEWESMGDGLYRRVKLMPRMDEAILSRWFFLWDDKINRMSRCSKGPSQPLKKPADLLPGEWTYVKEETAFYVKLPADKPLDSVRIRYPLRSSGVVFSREGSHLAVRNITATHVHNDGFNIHGAQRALTFENIAAIECGDDGFSAHEDGDCRIDGFVSIGNATGLCDTGTSRTYYKNVYIKDCVGYDLFFIGLEHSVENAIIESSAARAFHLDGFRLTDGQTCTLRMRNVSMQRVGGGANEVRVGRGGVLEAERCTITNLNIQVTPGGNAAIRKSLINGEPKPEIILWTNSLWRSEENVYDVAFWRVGQQVFAAGKLEDFRRLMGGETGSRALSPGEAAQGIAASTSSSPPSEVGMDPELLKPLRERANKILSNVGTP